MGVISWLADRFELVERAAIEKVQLERNEARFENAELRKDRLRLQEEIRSLRDERETLITQLVDANTSLATMEETAAHEHETAQADRARTADLQSQVDYLKEQVRIYQTRIGLLPQERQGQKDETPIRPLRRAREPFAVAEARIQTQRSEEYWRQRAAAAEAGTTGATTSDANGSEAEA